MGRRMDMDTTLKDVEKLDTMAVIWSGDSNGDWEGGCVVSLRLSSLIVGLSLGISS